MKTKQERQREIEELAEEFRQTPNMILLSFQGLTVAKDWELRRKLQQANVKFRVVKNTLARRAAQGTPVERVSDFFKGMTAIAMSKDDPVSLAKTVTEFAKENVQLQLRAALVEGDPIDPHQIEILAKLPTKTELISKIMFLINASTQRLMAALNGVARNLVVVLSQIRDRKQEQEQSG